MPKAKPVQVELPASVNLKVIESAEGVRGDTASNVTKPALLESGKTINVPLFIKEGEISQDRHPHRLLHGPGVTNRLSAKSVSTCLDRRSATFRR